MDRVLVFLAFFMFNCIAQAQQPNILWVTIEDTSPHFIGCYGNADAKTPNIDRLSREGVKFTNAFANAPVCSPARTTIITGVLNEVLGTGNHRSKYPLPDKIKGFPSYLKKAGWYTSNNAKTDYSVGGARKMIRDSWNESSREAGWWKRTDGQPFFSVFNHMNSHQSRTMTNPYRWYRAMIYDSLSGEERIGEAAFEMPPHFNDSAEMRRYFARVYNAISLTDKEIGKLLDKLEKDGLKDDTIIFFYADHGEAIPRGKSGSAGIGYKVPMVVWFPDKYKELSPWPIGSETDELICFDDLAPTVLSLAGIKPPEYMTGRPFMGKYRKTPGKYVFTSRNRIDESPQLARSITDGRYMYTKVFQPQFPELEYQKYADVSDIVKQIRQDYSDNKLNKVQSEMMDSRNGSEYLYDMDNDPWKLHNLAKKPEYREKVFLLKEKLYQHILEVRDVMFLPEYTMDSISAEMTPFEYRLQKGYELKKILDQAFLCGERKKPEEILSGLESENRDVVYWSLMGIQSLREIDLSGVRHKIMEKMHSSYLPVRILAAAIAFERLGAKEKAASALRPLLKFDNDLVTLQMLQNVQYMKGGPEFFKDDLKAFVALRKQDKSFLNSVSVAETTLFMLGEGELYYDNMKKWMD
ncbi:sulfatase family protein [Sinomicrobium weinanense]|uniref:Sulfatase n=1 Tax=Sinomicrobium weinanense TaxID=2842200 RepID=A0A926JVT0_9FLAO|nr:sulfatase [Sinomicrobium weinanense]MBC9798102.1 sulfatase [Sinomicrobium weinanense]MBU3125832.1 sulfatase [Sinomicrobium weinanense]